MTVVKPLRITLAFIVDRFIEPADATAIGGVSDGVTGLYQQQPVRHDTRRIHPILQGDGDRRSPSSFARSRHPVWA